MSDSAKFHTFEFIICYSLDDCMHGRSQPNYLNFVYLIAGLATRFVAILVVLITNRFFATVYVCVLYTHFFSDSNSRIINRRHEFKNRTIVHSNILCVGELFFFLFYYIFAHHGYFCDQNQIQRVSFRPLVACGRLNIHLNYYYYSNIHVYIIIIRIKFFFRDVMNDLSHIYMFDVYKHTTYLYHIIWAISCKFRVHSFVCHMLEDHWRLPTNILCGDWQRHYSHDVHFLTSISHRRTND